MGNTLADCEAACSAIRKRLTEIVNRAMSCDGVKVTVGIDPNATYPNGKRVSEVASFIFNGTRRMPPRPFLKQAMESSKSEIAKKMRRAIVGVMTKKEDIEDSSREIGETLMERARETMLEEGVFKTGKMLESLVVNVTA